MPSEPKTFSVRGPDLAAVLKPCGLVAGARVLKIGRASPAVEKQVDAVLAGFGGAKFGVEDERTSAEVAATVVLGDPFNVPLPADIGFCVVNPPLARIPDVFEELLGEWLADIVVPGGVVLTPFCRDASDTALDALKVVQPQVRETLNGFNRRHFGAEAVADPERLRERFANDDGFEFLGWAPRTRRAVADEAIVWLVLRRRPRGREGTSAFPRNDRPDRYPLRDLRGFVSALQDAGIALLPVDTLAARVQGGQKDQTAFGHIKLDLHRQIRRPLEVARMLSEMGVPALFLMMPRHPFNEGFFDAPETWNILRTIADGGHEIGMHIDVFHLMRAFGDLYAGIAAALDDFAKRGFVVRSATLHGDTRGHLLERGLVREDFFEEDAARSTWDGQPPVGEEFLADHVRRYSYRALAERFGIAYLAEERFRFGGRLLGEAPLTYVSDNSRSLAIRNIPVGGGSLTAPQPFRIAPEFARAAADVLRTNPFLALFHPQWFW